jgi:hypothetical protein
MPSRLAIQKSPEEIGPWVPGAVAKRIIGFQTILAFCLLCTTFLLAIIAWRLATVPPRLITQLPNGQFAALETNDIKINTDDVINFVQSILPRLYENSDGVALGIEELRSLNVVNPNIVDSVLSDMQRNTTLLKQKRFVQSAIIQTVNRKTLAIRYSQKVVYAEATGLLILTNQEGGSQIAPAQWAMLLFIKDIVDNRNNIVNRYGLYLQNIVLQPPGTINPTAPKPTGEENTPRTQSATALNSDQGTQNAAPEAPPLTTLSPGGPTPPGTKLQSPP